MTNNIYSAIRAIGELSGNGVYIYNTQTRKLIYANDAVSRIFDISHNSFISEPAFYLNHIVPEDLDHLREQFKKFEAEACLEHQEFRLIHHDSSIRHVAMNCYTVDVYIIGFISDITASKQHENYIINYGAKKNTLLDMVTHNLAGSLTVTKNLLDAMQNLYRKNESADLKEHLKVIQGNTAHCIDIVNEFLEEEHMVSEHIYTKRNLFDVVEKINEILDRFNKSYHSYHFQMSGNFMHLTLLNDDVKFLQVMNNLLSNAIKFSPPGSTIEVLLNVYNRQLIISVKDEGIGIPDHLQPLLFQRNTPASRKGLNGERSIGMGLYIVSRLITLMGGTISYKSQENQGSIFTISLPMHEGESIAKTSALVF